MKLQTLFAVAGVLAGCADPSHDPDAPAFDLNAPRVHIVSPARGVIAGDVTHVIVTGTASDESGSVASVSVNGVSAALADDGTWFAAVAVAPGTNLLNAIATDSRGNKAVETRAVVAGPMVAINGHVASGIHATLSAQALNALGRSTATFIETGGLMTAVQGMNPVVDAGGGPDCLYAQASITSFTVGDADVLMGPTDGGVQVSAVLDNVSIGMHLQWAASCFDGSRDVVLSAQRVTVQGLLAIGVGDRALDIQFDEPNVAVTGFELQLADVPDTIVQMLQLDTAISGILGLVTERLVVPMVAQSLAPLDDTRTVDVAGTQVDVDVVPTLIDFTPQGGTLVLETSLRARGDYGQFVLVPNLAPALDMANGFELAVADDAANQLLTSMWSAKAFDRTLYFAVGSYGQISQHYDSVQLQLMAPPHVEASGKPLQLTTGDWIATFKRGDVVAATVAIHAQSALYVVEVDDGKLRMDVSTPTVQVDVLDGRESITNAQYQAIKTFAYERVDALGSAAVAAIPLPALGNAMLTNLWIDAKAGYLHVAGNVE